MKTIHLGEITKPMIFFDSPYGNLQAVKALYDVLQKKDIPPEKIVCTGDLVGYFAQPEETVQFIKKWSIHSILGNFDQRAIDSSHSHIFTDEDKGFRPWHGFVENQLSMESIKWLRKLPESITLQMSGRLISVTHGSFLDISESVFQTSSWTRKQMQFDKTGSDIIIAGHSGIPFVDTYNKKSWLNPGSIGMPANDGTCDSWYLLVSPVADGSIIFEHKRLKYNYNETALLSEKKKLDFDYSQTLRTGLWSQKRPIPVKELNLRGKQIVLDTIILSSV